MPEGSHSIKITGHRFQPLLYPFAVPPDDLIIDSEGDNELIDLNKVVKNSTNLISRQISDHGIKLFLEKSKN